MVEMIEEGCLVSWPDVNDAAVEKDLLTYVAGEVIRTALERGILMEDIVEESKHPATCKLMKIPEPFMIRANRG